jgi:hypothetical protein
VPGIVFVNPFPVHKAFQTPKENRDDGSKSLKIKGIFCNE